MKKQVIGSLLDESSSLLQIANNELNRPYEDTVTRCVCHCTRNAAIGFFQAYLSKKGAQGVTVKSLENLLSECAGIDPDFKSLDISCFSCKSLEEDCNGGYCLSHEKVSDCYTKAKTIEKFVFDRIVE